MTSFTLAFYRRLQLETLYVVIKCVNIQPNTLSYTCTIFANDFTTLSMTFCLKPR